MGNTILLGREKEIHHVPEEMWKQHLAQTPQHGQQRLSFMTEAHHQVRYFVVCEMVKAQKPIEPEFISDKLQMPLERVNRILDELEEKLFFLVRNEHKAVSWAYPFTVEATPHKLIFNSGERLYAA
jgi:hypothetical protein